MLEISILLLEFGTVPAVGYFVVCHFIALYDFVHFYFDENREKNLLQYLAYASFDSV
jgi:hypothetical protein